MAEILKEWLTERLQRPINWDAEQFGEMMKNGCVIASVLRSYNVINDEKHFLIRSSNAHEEIINNWKHLSEWLKELDVNLPDTELTNVMEGRGSSLLRLFYQLFLQLDKRDRTDFIKRERKMVSELVEKMENRFKVEKVVEERESTVDDLSRPLLNERHYIEWQKKKTEQVQHTYNTIRHKYSKMLAKIEDSEIPTQFKTSKSPKLLSSREKADMERFAQRHPCKFENYTYDKLISMEEKAVERSKSFTDSEWTRNYMTNLYTKMHKKSDSEEFQKQITNVLSGSLWDISVAEEENKLDTGLAKKVMKLSQFEKQMCTQIMETKQQARNLVQNRIQGEKEFNNQREQQFDQFLDNIKEQIHLESVEIDFEKNRQNKLHERLYAEKMKRKRQYYYEICYDTMLSLVDYATKYAYFKKLIEDDIPDRFIHEWKTLYYKQQPIFDILQPMENVLKEPESEEKSAPEEEEIVRLELDRQEALNDNEFKEYHNYSYPWTLNLLIPNYDPESEERKYEYLGNRVLGHVIYTLLEIKYPYPPPRPPAVLPDFCAKVLLRGLQDRSITVPMQTLLNKRKIYVARLESAINFCLRKFKSEMVGCSDIQLSFDKYLAAAQEEEQKELIKLIKSEDDITTKISEANVAMMLGVTPPNSKQTQTPKTIPEEEIMLSPAADLGKYAYESLNFGDTLTDHLLAAMLVELIKDQPDIRGFVIINYPNSYREAQILEETFSGRAPPDEEKLDDRDDIFLEESIAKHRKKEDDQYKFIRISKIVNDPHKKRIEKPFESYFTTYIHLKETEDILQEIVIWDLTEENSDLIDRFYAVLGINYSMYYEVMGKDFLAQLCKYIIGDLVMPSKSYDSLFGYDVLSQLDFVFEAKYAKSKIIKPEVSNGKSRDKLRRASKVQSKMSISADIEVVKQPTSTTEEVTDEVVAILENAGEEEEYIAKSIISLEEVKILAGEENWDYAELPISKTIGVALASCWEVIEKVYIEDMQQLFFAIRLQMNCLIPYARFIKDKMEQIITMPSRKQDLVSKFQREYNDFEYDWRDINLAKNEWHCRVKKLQNTLYSICDDRKVFAEQQRQALIAENWTMEELTTMVNTYISCMQTELNQSFLTFQTFHDFYFAMIKQMPPTDRITCKALTKIYRELGEGSGTKRDSEDKVYRQLKIAYQELKNIQIDYSNNPFNLVIENNVKFALNTIKDTTESYRSLISKEYTEIAKIVIPVKKVEENVSVESISAEEIFKENALKCIDEWTMAINGEMFRVSLRILALQYKCYRDMKLFNDHSYKTFKNVQNDINTYYLNEIHSVDRLCKYLQMAVEDGRRIPETLVLEHDTFVIDPNLLQFVPPEPPVDTGELTEMVNGFEFKISQLADLRSQFKIIAPNGIALQQAFGYILQDFTLYGKESCNGPLFPEIWNRVNVELIPQFVFLLFGETCYVDWRDFLIYCLNMRFPTVEELLELRRNFRCCDLASTELVSREDFMNQEFWFDKEIDPEDKYAVLRNCLIKHFIFELFEVQRNLTNYPAFLLAFSKNVNPIEGFAMALSMAVGKKICFEFEECEEVVCKLIKEKKERDEILALILKYIEQFLDEVITKTVNTCERTTVVELKYTESVSTDKKIKKSRSAGEKSKKLGATQSASTFKSSRSLTRRSKIVQSETNVKTTFICRPCEDDETVQEKPFELEEIEEEQKAEPQVNPELAYAVSQNVIWNVLKICLPWHFVLIPENRKTPYVEQVEQLLKRLEVDTDNGDIYVSRFVKDENICKLLHKVKKFTALNFVEEIRKVCL